MPMTLSEHIDEVRQNLTNQVYPDEAAVERGVVQRLLGGLGWPIFDVQIIVPQFPIGRERVDYALCRAPSTPVVFIEVKGVGNIDESGEEQLFRYAFRKGVQEVVLTDGKEWHFFYPGGEGDFGERRVCKLDLVEEDTDEIGTYFDRYLNYDAVCSGRAVKAIIKDYNIKFGLPRTWQQLLEHPDEMSEMFTEVIACKAEERYGDRPTHEQVLDFLKTLIPASPKPQTKLPSVPPGPVTDTSQKGRKSARLLAVTMPDGTRIERKYAKDTFLEVIEKLGAERCAPHYSGYITDNLGTWSAKRKKNTRYYAKINEYYVFHGFNIEIKVKYLNRIAHGLGESLTIETPTKH